MFASCNCNNYNFLDTIRKLLEENEKRLRESLQKRVENERIIQERIGIRMQTDMIIYELNKEKGALNRELEKAKRENRTATTQPGPSHRSPEPGRM